MRIMRPFAPSNIKLRTQATMILVHNKSIMKPFALIAKTAYTTACPGKLQLHIADPQGLFVKITINIAYQSTYEFMAVNSISNEK